MSRQSSRRIYLEVPFPANKNAKLLGAHWDKRAGAWYVPAGDDPAPFLARWPRIEGDPSLQRPAEMPSDHYADDGKLLAAKFMGRLGGLAGGRKGGKARAQALSPERRKEIALMGVQAREQKRAMKRAAKALQERRSVLPDSPLFWTDGENPAPDDSDMLEPGKDALMRMVNSSCNRDLIEAQSDPVRPNEDLFAGEQVVTHWRSPSYVPRESRSGEGGLASPGFPFRGDDDLDREPLLPDWESNPELADWYDARERETCDRARAANQAANPGPTSIMLRGEAAVQEMKDEYERRLQRRLAAERHGK